MLAYLYCYCEMMIPSPVQVKPQMILWVMSQVTP